MTRQRRMVIRTPEDVAALVPYVLGFHPEESLVVLTFGAHPAFHARVDLPDNDHDRVLAVALLVDAARRNRIGSVIPVCYATDPERARLMVLEVERGFAAVGVSMLSPIRIADGAWFSLSPQHASVEGLPLDLDSHPFLAETVLEGRVTHASRAALVASLRTDPAQAEQVRMATEALAPESVPGPEEVGRLVRRHLADDSMPGPDEMAGLVMALDAPEVRSEVRSLLASCPATDHLRFWSGVVRTAPEPWIGEPLAALGLAAWLGGDGAVGWCVVDLLGECAPEHPVRTFLVAYLEQALPPDARSLAALGGWGDR